MKTKDFSLLESGREDYNDFMQWLQDHNWCKVVNCCRCQRWRQYQHNHLYGFCEKAKETKSYDDYCSEALEVTKNEL